mmetsp:Transcript_38573/g.110802  ORF Transcript_38573/g.110802 Transcript_38573/m.110802 type:complete len:229 (-) Transcript_38573:524-1210(-)
MELAVLRRDVRMPRVGAVCVVHARLQGRLCRQKVVQICNVLVVLLGATQVCKRADDHGAKRQFFPGVAQGQQDTQAEASTCAVASQDDLGRLVPAASLQPVIARQGILDRRRPRVLWRAPRVDHTSPHPATRHSAHLARQTGDVLEVRLARERPVPATMQEQHDQLLRVLRCTAALLPRCRRFVGGARSSIDGLREPDPRHRSGAGLRVPLHAHPRVAEPRPRLAVVV